MQWAVPDRIAVLEAVAAAAFTIAAVAALLTNDWIAAGVAGIAAVVLAAAAIRDRVARVRLSADPEGVTVVEGFARRRTIPWSGIIAIRVDERSRRGLSSRLLEIDAGETVHLLSGREMGAEPADVAAALAELRP